jgi:hypothetical protein
LIQWCGVDVGGQIDRRSKKTRRRELRVVSAKIRTIAN